MVAKDDTLLLLPSFFASKRGLERKRDAEILPPSRERGFLQNLFRLLLKWKMEDGRINHCGLSAPVGKRRWWGRMVKSLFFSKPGGKYFPLY